jgi:hypothetical protein
MIVIAVLFRLCTRPVSANGIEGDDRGTDHGKRRAADHSFVEAAMCNRNSTVIRPRSAPRWQAQAMLLGAAIGALIISTTAVAAPAGCAARADVLKQLAKQYHEAPVAVGLINVGALVEVLTSQDGSTWTILVDRPDGTSCLFAAGEGWQNLKRAASPLSDRDGGT